MATNKMRIKQKVIRKSLNGDWEPFTFNVKSKSFFVKNFTDGDIYASFVDDGDEEGSFLIRSLTAEEIYISEGIITPVLFVDTVYIKGSGVVEVEALDF